MQESISAMLYLSKEDRIFQTNKKILATYPQKKEKLLLPLTKVEEQLKGYQEQIADYNNQIREREMLIAIEREKIKLSDERMLAVKNQKEYAAAQKEIETSNKIIKRVEDQIIEVGELKEPIEKKEKTSWRNTKRRKRLSRGI